MNTHRALGRHHFLIKKKDGSTRFCADYRKLSSITKLDVYLLQRLDDALDRLHGCTYFTTLDLMTGYWQAKLDPKNANKFAFIIFDSLFQFNSSISLRIMRFPGYFSTPYGSRPRPPESNHCFSLPGPHLSLCCNL